MHSVLNHNVPEKKGVVRVDDFHQMLAVEPVSTGGARGWKMTQICKLQTTFLSLVFQHLFIIMMTQRDQYQVG